ncbi:S-layer homology domain-containing protein [Paenibacillus sp. FSL R7-0331]|uniref:S-layer homology domain-containing protein n=2 Tax=Paenibacillus sp. FSL R7-0331 TaxID=1536773 RepID=UPI0012E06BD6|nr:S-layer homology domain-containing protein [Paenibacillus sp. FSL R7-0331]
MKKKLAVSTLAVSMAAASVAGFPFSSEGLAKHLGVSVASAATGTTIFDTLKTRASVLYASLTTEEKAILRDFRTELQGLSQAQLEADFAPVVDKLTFLDSADKTLFYELYSELVDSYYTTDLSAVTDIQQSPNYQAYKDLLKKVATNIGVPNLTVDDLYNTLFGTAGVEQTLIPILKGKGETVIAAALLDPSSDLFKQVETAVYGVKVGSSTVKDVVYGLNDFNVTKADFSAVKTNLEQSISPAKAKAAALVLAHAYYTAYLQPSTNPGTSNPGTGVVTNPTATPGIYDVSSLVSVVNGKATLKLVDADVLKAFDALLAANPGKTGLTLTLNLGTVNATVVEVPLSKAIIEAAKAKGIANIAITFNGLTVTIPVSQFSDAVTLTVTTEADSTVTSLTSQKLASKVYSFDLTVGGVATTVFKQPLTIKLPLVNTTGLDKELLSVAKVVYGALQYHGGVVDGEHIVEPRDTFSSYAVVENKVTFSDIANVQAWAGRQIQVVAAKGAIEGIGSGKFAPKSNVTRAEFSKMLIRALNLENSTATESFSDVASTAWYAPYVAVAAEKGIITGRNASTFDPNATITRAEMATMISRAVKSINPAAATDASALSKFSDAAKISASLKDGVAFAASNNLVIGNGGKFNPNDTATRAEAAVIIYRTINFK